MRTLKALLIEDEEPSMINLQSSLKDLPFLDIIASTDNLEDGEKEILFHKPDILFLDIVINGEPVFDLLKRLESRNMEFGIVFITAHHDTYLKSAIDSCGLKYKFAYLGKPIHAARLISTVNKLRKEMSKPQEDIDNTLIIYHQSGLIRLYYDEIFYCGVEGNETAIFTTDEKKEIVHLSLRQLYERLPHQMFYRMSGQYVINRQYVRSVYKSRQGHYVCQLRVGINEARLRLPAKQWKFFREEFTEVEDVE